MTRARGILVSLVASACTPLMLSAQSSDAQSDAETLADIRSCGSLERDRARLACFDGVLAAERTATGAAVPTGRSEVTQAAAPPRSVASETPVAAAARAAAPASRGAVTTEASAEPARGAAIDSNAVRNERAKPASADDDGSRTITIVGLNDDLPGAARFVTDSGRVLLQTSGGTPRGGFPDLPFEATLEPGALGSLFLGVSERRRIRVRWVD